MRFLLFGFLVAAACARAQDTYPSKPIQVVLPLQAASASDIAVRIVAERMAELLGQGVVVENVSGVGGLIGTNRVAAARPDGYTLAALNNSILTILPHMQKGQTKFDSFSDFVPLRGFANIPTYLGVPKDSPATRAVCLFAPYANMPTPGISTIAGSAPRIAGLSGVA